MFPKLRYIFLLLLFQKCKLSLTEFDICAPGQNDVLFLIDTSTSIQESNLQDQAIDNWSYIINFLKLIIEKFHFSAEPAVRVGIIPYSSQVDPGFSVILTKDRNAVLTSIEMLKYRYFGGNTNTSGALRQARYTFEQNRNAGRRKIVVLVTDGQSNVDEDLTLAVAKENKLANITHFVVAITPYVNKQELRAIIDEKGDFYYLEVPQFENLEKYVSTLQERINCPIPPKEGCTDVRADICFLLDSSGSIVKDDVKDYTDWNSMKKFLLDIVDQLIIGSDNNRISLIQFSDSAMKIFSLDFSFSADEIKRKIMEIRFIGGYTNTKDALNKMYQQVFTASNGDRPDAPNIGIVITDGKSNVQHEETIPAANEAKSRGIRIFAVGLTSSIELAELEGIASHPAAQHVFTRNTISLVSTVVTNLIFNLCHQTCFTNCSSVNRCKAGMNLVWQTYLNKKLVGSDYFVIDGVTKEETCQNNCLQEDACRSIEYMQDRSICNLARITKDELSPALFIDDASSRYSQWTCI